MPDSIEGITHVELNSDGGQIFVVGDISVLSPCLQNGRFYAAVTSTLIIPLQNEMDYERCV